MAKPGNCRRSAFARRAITAMLTISLGISLGIMIAVAVPYLSDEAEMGQLQDAYTQPAEESAPYPTIDWESLSQDNPDAVGWIYVPGTNIDYPVVAAPQEDPTHYLRHNLSGTWSPAGTPYLDSGCNRDFTSFNSVIFGHHLINDTMLSAFANYVDEAYFNAHRTIYLLTPNEVLTLRVVAANVIDGYSEEKRVLFSDRNSYLDYWRSQLSESEVVAYDAPQSPTRDFCFVTCSYQTPNARTLVYAVVEDEAAC